MNEIEKSFFDGKGRLVDGSEAIIPIFTKKNGIWKFLASAFYISKYGIIITAKHVVINSEKLQYDPLFAIHIYERDGKQKYIPRHVRNYHIHKTADIAILVLDQYTDTKTGYPLFNKVLTLTKNIPSKDSAVKTFAYPTSKIIVDAASIHVFCSTSWYFGKINKHYQNGRDKTLLPEDCFEVELDILGGASGGPVFDERGLVFGINSTGIDGTDIGFVSSLSPIWNMVIPSVNTKSAPKNPTVQNLVDDGHVALK